MRGLLKKFFKDKETCLVTLWLILLAVYYGVRMFTLTPWYDELYTYYYFISKGPVYAAIHWPLPNNHVGYSVLSGIIDWFLGSAAGLRGISYLASLLGAVVLYSICRKVLRKGWSVCCVIIFTSMSLVNQLAVQGRGYALSTLCLLIAFKALQCIAADKGELKGKSKKYYITFSLSMVLGLYTIPSSVYWVVPVCVSGGLFFLLVKEYRKLLSLIVASLTAAFLTVLLYGTIWLAIGSNLLSKVEGSAFFGKGHVKIILTAPLLSAKTGIEYMLATPYIQSVSRESFFSGLWEWMKYLFNSFFVGSWPVLMGIAVAGSIAVIVRGYLRRKQEKEYVLLCLCVLCLLWLTPVILIIQSTLPYFRVFSYLGIPLALMICLLGERFFPERLPWGIYVGVFGTAGVLFFTSPDYNAQYGANEYYAMDALKNAELESKKTLCVTDCNQQYLLKYGWGIQCESTQIEGADMVLLKKEITDPGHDPMSWEYYHSYDTVPWPYIENKMTVSYENEAYLLFVKK